MTEVIVDLKCGRFWTNLSMSRFSQVFLVRFSDSFPRGWISISLKDKAFLLSNWDCCCFHFLLTWKSQTLLRICIKGIQQVADLVSDWAVLQT